MTQSLLTPLFQREFTRQPRPLNLGRVVDLGLVEYKTAFQFQLGILEQRITDKCCDTLILCEHFPVFTLGRSGDKKNILVKKQVSESQNLEIIPVNRGGSITFHGPGQLVAYPIFDLTKHKKDLRFFLNRLEQIAIEFLKYFDCLARRKKGFTGVWFKDCKIASIGIGVKKWVSFHGLAININTDLRYFSRIKPCGLDVKMVSLAEIKDSKIDMEFTKKVIIEKFEAVFDLKFNRSAEIPSFQTGDECAKIIPTSVGKLS